MTDDQIRQAFEFAVIEHLGPEALAHGTMSIYQTAEIMFEAGYKAALASLEQVAYLYKSEDPFDAGEWRVSYDKINRKEIVPLYRIKEQL